MRQLLLLLVTLNLFGNVSGQKIEFSASLNSGLFSFKGDWVASKNTVIINGIPPYSDHGIVCNPYGSRNGMSYGASFNFKKIYQEKFFWGVDLGYEVLRSKVNIDHAVVYYHSAIEPHNADSAVIVDISGKSFLVNSFININPFIGYRLSYNKIKTDIAVGFDLGYYLKNEEKSNATKPDGTAYDIKLNPTTKDLNFDFRPRIQISTKYKKVGVYLGYSYGLSNYLYKGIKYLPELRKYPLESRLIRFGVTYKLK